MLMCGGGGGGEIVKHVVSDRRQEVSPNAPRQAARSLIGGVAQQRQTGWSRWGSLGTLEEASGRKSTQIKAPAGHQPDTSGLRRRPEPRVKRAAGAAGGRKSERCDGC